jgi:uncharacterized protein (TIGR02687 family)
VSEIVRIQEALARKFSSPLGRGQTRRVVFWYDDEGSIGDLDLLTVVPEGVRFLRLGKNTFSVKKTIEHDEPTSSFLVYAPFRRPKDQENWLLDIELYSQSFAADRAAIFLDELGYQDMALREVVKQRRWFFENKDRRKALGALGLQKPNAEEMDRGIVTVLAGARSTSSELIIRHVLMGGLDDDTNKPLGEMTKTGVEQVFWLIAKEHLAYEGTPPTLRSLFHAIVLTATVEELRLDKPMAGWKAYLLPDRARSRAVVFVDNWLTHSEHCQAYEELSAQAWRDLEMDADAADLSMEAIAGGRTFEAFDRLVMNAVVEGLHGILPAVKDYSRWLEMRSRSYWWPRYERVWEALRAAIGLLELSDRFDGRFQEKTARGMAEAYVEDYHQADRLYREFIAARRLIEGEFPSALDQRVEDLYTNWFLPKLLDRWTTLVESDMASDWGLDGVKNQRDFYKQRVEPRAKAGEKLFIIISDGLRYETAVKLAEDMEAETRSRPNLEWVLGTVPSITEMCMATLLPHDALTWTKESGVRADGMSTTGSANREKVLKARFEASLVTSYKELMGWSVEEARERTVGPKVIYVYHNWIDMLGDKVATEAQTFDAASQAIDELKRLIKRIGNSLNGINFVITSDHGFLFQQSPVPENDKLSVEKIDSIHAGRRDVVGKKGQDLPGTVEIGLDYLLGDRSGLSVYVPRGNTRFSSGGGARYVHGGASLQEVIVPVMTYKFARSGYKSGAEARRVEVELTTVDRRVTSNPFVLTFHQAEKVEGKVTPRSLRVAFYTTGDVEEKVSNEELLVADVASDRAQDRSKTLTFHLNPKIGNGEYVLRLINDDPENREKEYRRYSFKVSLAINRIDFWS